jgi:hypothetical protein
MDRVLGSPEAILETAQVRNDDSIQSILYCMVGARLAANLGEPFGWSAEHYLHAFG